MFNTKNFIDKWENVPSTWVFEHYLNLPELLIGQDIKIKSIFNPMEKTPSFCIYVDQSIMQYKFKDFSTGKGGSKIDLIKFMFNLDVNNAITKLTSDYNKYNKSSQAINKTVKSINRWKVDFIKKRQWTKLDKDFWLSFRIGKTLLTEYNVNPIEYYNLIKDESDKIESLTINPKCGYGYFDKDNDVYKIYQPFNKKYKFCKVKSYLQGKDQLSYNKPYLVICSSLKDAMCLKSIGYNIDVISPDSENTIIKPHIIQNFKNKYQKVITVFDNDDAGKKAVKVYHDRYNIHGFVPTISKDISDAMREHGFDKVHKMLKPLLKQTLNK
tara:strand:- start:107 stop:1084 length:978 start_codon:yes stop_codon:yes gene_type:complete